MDAPLAAWHDLDLVERVEGGNRNEVWRGTLRGATVAVRRSRRSPESLEWELGLIDRLASIGIGVATLLQTDDGRSSSGGIVVQRWVEGRPPDGETDWGLVADALADVHGIGDVPQRPGAAIVTRLGRTGRSVDADLAAVPDEVAAVVLAVFASMKDAPVSLVHGDPNPTNIRIDDDGRVWLLDWDESRVDVSWHDLSNLGVRVLDPTSHARALRLSHAWEAVNAWTVEPAYARRRFELLVQTLG